MGEFHKEIHLEILETTDQSSNFTYAQQDFITNCIPRKNIPYKILPFKNNLVVKLEVALLQVSNNKVRTTLCRVQQVFDLLFGITYKIQIIKIFC